VNKVSMLLVLLLIVLAFFKVYCGIPAEDGFYQTRDEGAYFDYSVRLAQQGFGRYTDMVGDYFADKKNWSGPFPFRVGYVFVTATAFKVFGPSFRAMAVISLICYILLVGFSFYFTRKSFGTFFAAGCALLLAFSPLQMAMARRALPDSMGCFLVILSLWLFLRFISEGCRVRDLVSFVFAYTAAMLVKEQFLLLLPLFALMALVYKYKYGAGLRPAHLFAIIAMPLVMSLAVWYLTAGRFMLAACGIVMNIRQLAPYAQDFCRGPWPTYIIDYFLISPVTTFLGLSFFCYKFIGRSWLDDQRVWFFAAAAAWVYLAFSGIDGFKNVRYVLVLDVFLRLFVMLALDKLFDGQRLKTFYMSLAVLGLVYLDYFNFDYLFCAIGLYDPVSYWLLKARLMIPAG